METNKPKIKDLTESKGILKGIRVVELGGWINGVGAGTHRYAKDKAGKTNYAVIVEKASGRKEPSGLRFREIARNTTFGTEDLALYDALYVYLSDFVHPRPERLEDYYDGTRWRVNDNSRQGEAFIYSSLIVAMIMDQVLRCFNLPTSDSKAIIEATLGYRAGLLGAFAEIDKKSRHRAAKRTPLVARAECLLRGVAISWIDGS